MMGEDYEKGVEEPWPLTVRLFKLGELVYVRSLMGREWLGLVLSRMRSGEYVVSGFPWRFAKAPGDAPRPRVIVSPAFLFAVGDR